MDASSGAVRPRPPGAHPPAWPVGHPRHRRRRHRRGHHRRADRHGRHLDGKGVTVLDMTGLAQKGGSVFSHIRIADRPGRPPRVRIGAGEADAVIGGDLVVTASADALAGWRWAPPTGGQLRRDAPPRSSPRNPDWVPATRCRPPSSSAVGRRTRFPRRRQPGHRACSATPSPPTCSARLRLAAGLGAGERGQPRQGHR